ncbi:MAG: pseudouridine-5'-phosphate glycosidase [Paracoccaceae bacterium]|nr:pseudouridine-5'-phosphate glycosidase [Paracoccaceae bacterium]MDG2259127.1 pseudouridine-5'-phosphate glycosidase [Paracoccaceae bacterium]
MMTLHYSDEVAAALQSKSPIVALESTIITHGMPFPQNLETARLVEEEVRNSGAIPATIAVLNGHLHIGLSDRELTDLAQSTNVSKLSRADLAACIAKGETGATTVAATMIAAKVAGIHVFATGGIGGVHSGAEDSFDISADLQELAQTDVIVVAAGAKAILDLPKTWEVLETLGVPVIAYGQDELPAFWSASSPHSAPIRMDTALEIANAAKLRKVLDVPGGHLVCNPIPAHAEIKEDVIGPIIAKALSEASSANIQGKAVTPFLLQRIFELTGGKSLDANIQLVFNNARLASQIAIEMA